MRAIAARQARPSGACGRAGACAIRHDQVDVRASGAAALVLQADDVGDKGVVMAVVEVEWEGEIDQWWSTHGWRVAGGRASLVGKMQVCRIGGGLGEGGSQRRLDGRDATTGGALRLLGRMGAREVGQGTRQGGTGRRTGHV